MKRRSSHHVLILLIILILGFSLRFYKLGTIPSFHGDEVDFAYNGSSLLRTGKDTTGASYPVGTTSTGDLRPAVYAYLAGISTGIFGFNEFATRLPTVGASVLLIIVIFFLGAELFNLRVGLVAGFVTAVSYWNIILSREASEKVVSVLFLTSGILFLIRYVRSKRIPEFIVGLIMFALSVHTYYSPRIFLLLFLPVYYLATHTQLDHKSRVVYRIGIGFLLTFILYFSFFYKTSTERIHQLLIFTNSNTISILSDQIAGDGNQIPVVLTRMFHNKVVNFAYAIFRNYGEYFTFNYWVSEGGFPWRIKVPQTGLMNLAELPFLFFGTFLLMEKLFRRRNGAGGLLFFWIIISVIPASLTFDEIPNAYRTFLMAPAFSLVLSYGLVGAYEVLQKKLSRNFFRAGIALFVFFYLWNVSYFLHQYFVHYPNQSAPFRNSAQKELGLFLKDRYKNMPAIYVTKIYGGTEQLLKFYLGYSPLEHARRGFPKDADNTGFYNIIFVSEKCPYPDLLIKDDTETHTGLFVNASDCKAPPVGNDRVVADIDWVNGRRAYTVIEALAD